MPIGPGKYDELCTYVREKAGATGAIVIVIDGTSGPGFSVQATPEITMTLPDVLMIVATEIQKSLGN